MNRLHRHPVTWLCLAACLATAAAQAADKIELRLRLKKGDVLTCEELTQHEMYFVDIEIGTTTTTRFGMSWHVTDVDAQGTMTVKATYDRVAFKSEVIGQGAIDYDSRKPPTEIAPMAQPYAARVGKSYTMRIRPDGTVVDVQGFTEILRAVEQTVDLPDGPARDMVLESNRNLLNNDTARQIHQQDWGFYPPQPVAVGDTWSRSDHVTVDFPMIIQSTFKLTSADDKRVALSITNKLKSDHDATDLVTAQTTYDVSGTVTTQLQLDARTGFVLERKTVVKTEGTMATLEPGQKPEPVAIRTRTKSITRARGAD